MLIRVEIPVDAMGIDALLRQAFGRDNEADLLQKLREEGLITLGMVATDDNGHVIGYAAFSPVDVAGEDRQWVGLAPLAVEESQRHQGIATRMVYEGLDTLNEFGYRAVVVLGDPAYYGRLGFLSAISYGLTCNFSGTTEAFQIYPLTHEALIDVKGQVNYSTLFHRF